MKQRKINSTKKVYESVRYFDGVDRYEGRQGFKIYIDRNIGFSNHWQRQLKESVKLVNFRKWMMMSLQMKSN